MHKEKSVLIDFLGENPVVRIIDFLIENKGLDYSKEEIAEGAGISRTTLYKVWYKLEEMKVVKETRRFAKAKLYVLNEENPIVQKFLNLELELIKNSVELVKDRAELEVPSQ